jgi:hypothetical protein
MVRFYGKPFHTHLEMLHKEAGQQADVGIDWVQGWRMNILCF